MYKILYLICVFIKLILTKQNVMPNINLISDNRKCLGKCGVCLPWLLLVIHTYIKIHHLHGIMIQIREYYYQTIHQNVYHFLLSYLHYLILHVFHNIIFGAYIHFKPYNYSNF